jgi:hypothetical protein
LNAKIISGFRVIDRKGVFWAACALDNNRIKFIRANDGHSYHEIEKEYSQDHDPKMGDINLNGKILNIALDKQQNRFVLFLV